MSLNSDHRIDVVLKQIKVLLVAENISLRQSGETSISYHYLVEFLKKNINVRAICHARVRDDLRQDLPPELFSIISFVEDTRTQKFVYALGKHFHYRIADLVFGQLLHILTQASMRSIAKRLIRQLSIEVVFQPSPISPKAVSFMYGMGVPVVIGPMCGGLELPPAFRSIDGFWVTWSITLTRHLADVLNKLIPGKLHAAALIVGNQRTSGVLPTGARGRVYEVVESGVDLDKCAPKTYGTRPSPDTVRFVFCGRLVDWKGAQYVVKAFAPLAKRGGAVLDLIGDGELFGEIRTLVSSEGLNGAVILHGRLSVQRCTEIMQQADVYVMPSLRECGGLALLEAMGIGLPIVATNWLAPAEYLDHHCAILVEPSSEKELVDGFTAAMEKLRDFPNLRRTMGEAARKRVFKGYYCWQKKADRIIEILNEVRLDRLSE